MDTKTLESNSCAEGVPSQEQCDAEAGHAYAVDYRHVKLLFDSMTGHIVGEGSSWFFEWVWRQLDKLKINRADTKLGCVSIYLHPIAIAALHHSYLNKAFWISKDYISTSFEVNDIIVNRFSVSCDRFLLGQMFAREFPDFNMTDDKRIALGSLVNKDMKFMRKVFANDIDRQSLLKAFYYSFRSEVVQKIADDREGYAELGSPKTGDEALMRLVQSFDAPFNTYCEVVSDPSHEIKFVEEDMLPDHEHVWRCADEWFDIEPTSAVEITPCVWKGDGHAED